MIFKHFHPSLRNPIRVLLILTITYGLLQWSVLPVSASYEWNLIGPPGSGQFGYSVTALPNGNLVVTDPYYDKVAIADVGAVYLYNGVTHALISTLTGSTANDRVGIAGVKALANGNFVVASPLWNNEAATFAGAVTWGSGTTGVSGEVSAANSLVGSTTGDQVGFAVTTLTNGNYVVRSPFWDSLGPLVDEDVGAVTWGDGDAGTKGPVYSTNSLVGGTAYDRVGMLDIVELKINDYYVVRSQQWDNGVTNAGAATRVNSSTGLPFGKVSSDNSLVGSTANDQIGINVIALTNGNYVVGSPFWDDAAVDVGVVTLVNGVTGLPKGEVESSSSLTGGTFGDSVGEYLTALTNGNYIVRSPRWDGSASDTGAATWVNGATGQPKEAVSSSNSLVGDTANDQVGLSMAALTNGNYVVSSPLWDDAAADVGAVTWVNGANGNPKGEVSSDNSLVGGTAVDLVGSNVTALTNGNYVVCSRYWDLPGLVIDAGAATWVNGANGNPKGEVSSENSLVGSAVADQVGVYLTALTNGNYVVSSPAWDGVAVDTGAVTWGDGDSGITNPVSSLNSLVGSQLNDFVGNGGVIALTDGNYVVASLTWDSSDMDVGAATWGNGSSGITGPVSTSNSLVGSAANDQVGFSIIPMTIGDYLVSTPGYDSIGTPNIGALTWGTAGATGALTADNSVFGSVMNQGSTLKSSYNAAYVYLVVGKPMENKVTLFWLSRILSPVIKK